MRSASAAAACALAALAGASVARAGDRAPAPPQVDCALVRHYVAEHGRTRALAWAVENGFSWAQIAAARRCKP